MIWFLSLKRTLKISKDITELTEKLPSKIESLIDSPTMAFGFDIAITRNGELYLFEANRAPAVKTVLARTSRLRIQYYEYILNNYDMLKGYIAYL